MNATKNENIWNTDTYSLEPVKNDNLINLKKGKLPIVKMDPIGQIKIHSIMKKQLGDPRTE